VSRLRSRRFSLSPKLSRNANRAGSS
jgi:hypothetical protein